MNILLVLSMRYVSKHTSDFDVYFFSQNIKHINSYTAAERNIIVKRREVEYSHTTVI